MKRVIILGAVILIGLVLCITLFAMVEETEKEIPLSEVPKKAITGAQKSVDGIKFVRAEAEEEDGVLIYDLEGVADGKEYEIEVTAEGKVLEVEQEEDDDDDDDDGDDE
ncbi:PepSY domain-containing protein [Candidatus Latescibacterota bacterium]